MQQLNELDDKDEPDVIEAGPDVIISDFSDDEGNNDLDNWA